MRCCRANGPITAILDRNTARVFSVNGGLIFVRHFRAAVPLQIHSFLPEPDVAVPAGVSIPCECGRPANRPAFNAA